MAVLLRVALTAVIVLGATSPASADEGNTQWVSDTSGGWLNLVTHVYEPYPLVRDGQTYPRASFWMFSARRLRVHVESLSAPLAAASLRAQLPVAWSRATRGRGMVEIVERDWDVHLFAVGGEGVSNNRSEFILGRWTSIQYVYETNGRETNDMLALSLHEIAHNWCCFGPGTGDPRYLGRFDGVAYGHYLNCDDGLMCVVDETWLRAKFGGRINCPSWCSPIVQPVFSERELATMGLWPDRQ